MLEDTSVSQRIERDAMAEYADVWLEDADESWPGDGSECEALREVLAPEYRDLSPSEIDELVANAVSGMSPEEAESFWKTAGNLAKGIGKVATHALPVAAPIVGTVFGGPVGGALGKVAGQALAGTLAPPTGLPIPTGLASPGPGPGPPGDGMLPGGADAGSAVRLLMWLLQHPALLQSILGQVLGPAGQSSVPVGSQGAAAPFGAFMNTLSVVANKAAAEAESATAFESFEEMPEYLRDAGGNLRCADPALPESRAEALLAHLRESDDAGSHGPQDELTRWFQEAGLV
jgi:hypothetical protein